MLFIDAQLSPGLALWITNNFGLECYSVSYWGLRDAKDTEIFQKASGERYCFNQRLRFCHNASSIWEPT
jgi:predicted nuclease of predicted toxin-antitoxin system